MASRPELPVTVAIPATRAGADDAVVYVVVCTGLDGTQWAVEKRYSRACFFQLANDFFSCASLFLQLVGGPATAWGLGLPLAAAFALLGAALVALRARLALLAAAAFPLALAALAGAAALDLA